MTGSEITQSVQIDEMAILRSLNLNPQDPKVQALLLVCRKYELDPVLKHMVLISGNPYITRDGLLHVAHRSGQFDGIGVVDEGETSSEWWAKVSVYRKDMSHPFTYRGRYPKDGPKHMAKFGPEMAMKVAEVMALRRAFDVTGIGAAEERWDTDDVVVPEPVPAASAEDVERIGDWLAVLDEDSLGELRGWCVAQGMPRYDSGRLTEAQAKVWLDHLENLLTEAELVDDDELEPLDGETDE